jgi:hypothetical protein
MKLIEATIEENPAKCNDKNKISIDDSLTIDNGTYNVQPALTPPSINIELNNKLIDVKTNNKDKLLILGNIISDEHINSGNRILPNPPNKIGMIIKNIIESP